MIFGKEIFFFINLITRSNHIWVGSWNIVGSHSFFGGEVIGASLVAFFEAWEREREIDSEACSVGRERVRESFWNFWIGVSMKKRERRNWVEKKRVTRLADVSDWVIQFLSIRSIEWLGLKKLHTVQYPRYCTGCESAATSPLASTWMMIFQISLLFPLSSLVRNHLLKSYFSLESQQGISFATKRQCFSAFLIFVLFILFL